jgi:hypothetical protein
MFGIFGDTSSASLRILKVLEQGEWFRYNTKSEYALAGSNRHFPRFAIVSIIAIDLDCGPWKDREIRSNSDGQLIVSVKTEVWGSTITIGDWVPDWVPKVYTLTTEELNYVLTPRLDTDVDMECYRKITQYRLRGQTPDIMCSAAGISFGGIPNVYGTAISN